MSKNIDKLFQERLSSRNFTPSNSEWANMERLIETELGGGSEFGAKGGISINILFSGFFILLLAGGLALSQVLNKNKSFVQLENNDSATFTENTKIKSQNSKEEQFVIKNETDPDQDISQLEGQIEKSNTSSNIEKENNNASKLSSANDPSDEFNFENDKKAARADRKEVNGEMDIVKQTEKSYAEKYGTPSNPPFLNNKSEKSKTINTSTEINTLQKSEGSSYKKNKNGQNGDLILAGLVAQNTTSNGNSISKVDPKLNDLSNYNAIHSEDAKLNDSYDYHRDNVKSTKNKKGNRSMFLFESSLKDLNKNHLTLISKPIFTFNDFRKIDQVQLPEKEEDLFKTQQKKAKRKLPIQFSAAALGEVAWVSKKIKGNNEFSSLIQIRSDQEKGLLKFNGGLEFQAKYKGFGFNTGFMISNYGENVQYEEKYLSEWEVSNELVTDTLWTQEIEFVYDSVISPIDSTWIIIVVDSMFVSVVDSILITNQFDSTEVLSPIGLANQNGKTQISYWEIPLYFSYQFDIDKFYISPGLGVTIGFWKMTRGHYMAKDEQSLIPINTDYAVLRRTIINANLVLGVGYRINDHFSIEASPSFRFNVNNLFVNDEIIQKYKSISLQFRLRYYF